METASSSRSVQFIYLMNPLRCIDEDVLEAPGRNALNRLLKKQEHSLYNRLRSILFDSAFVRKICRDIDSKAPVVANLRCGLWYVPNCQGTCYFKSTDGHCNNWQFNLKRLNLHVLGLLAENRNCIIVDATRKGKRFPDSFSRTMPIWVCVMNRVLAIKKGKQNDEIWSKLRMPPWIPESERSLVERILPEFVTTVLNADPVQAEITRLAETINFPVCCYWVSHDTGSIPDRALLSWNFPIDSAPYLTALLVVADPNFLHLWLISASNADKASLDSTYIQGGGDDHETWSLGLTPALFWKHHEDILRYSDDVEEQIRTLVRTAAQEEADDHSDVTDRITWLGSTRLGFALKAPVDVSSVGLLVDCSPTAQARADGKYLAAPVSEGKADKNKLSKVLPKVLSECRSVLPNHPILVVSTDSATAICVCLGILVEFFDQQGCFRYEKSGPSISKDSIKSSLLLLQSLAGDIAAPPRWMLTDLNRFFLTSAENQPRILQQWRQAEQQSPDG